MDAAAAAILREQALEAFGVCSFACIQDSLRPCRAAARLPEHPQSVLVALFPYRFEENGPRNLCRYACVPDYHKTAGAVLEKAAAALRRQYPDNRFEPFIDNSPVPEVEAAVRAGLGCRGDNGLLLHPVYGSYVFIGTIVTDRYWEATNTPLTGCRHCGACKAACPAGCIGRGGRDGCLSAVSQKKGELTAEEQRMLREGGLVWGCDRCQEVCPANRGALIRPHPCFDRYKPWLSADDLDDLQDKAYGWRGRAVPERNLNILYDK